VLREAHYFIIVLMFILLLTTLLTFFLTFTIRLPQEDEIPRRSRPVLSVLNSADLLELETGSMLNIGQK
jgi:hypothetical protein